MVEALSLPRYLDSSIPIAVAFSEGFGQVWAMVALKFVEIFWIRCPQNWRLILGYLSSEKKGNPCQWVQGWWSKKKQVCPRERTLKHGPAVHELKFFFLFPLHQVVSQILSVNRYDGSHLH